MESIKKLSTPVQSKCNGLSSGLKGIAIVKGKLRQDGEQGPQPASFCFRPGGIFIACRSHVRGGGERKPRNSQDLVSSAHPSLCSTVTSSEGPSPALLIPQVTSPSGFAIGIHSSELCLTPCVCLFMFAVLSSPKRQRLFGICYYIRST